MAENSKSVLLPVMAVAVFAGLGRMVFQKIKADRRARETRTAGPVDEKTRQWISDVVRTPPAVASCRGFLRPAPDRPDFPGCPFRPPPALYVTGENSPYVPYVIFGYQSVLCEPAGLIELQNL